MALVQHANKVEPLVSDAIRIQRVAVTRAVAWNCA